MPIITSKFKTGLDNLGIEESAVVKIKKGAANPANPRLWVLYFCGVDEGNSEKVVRTWYFESEKNREKDIQNILQKYPNIVVE
ncbi:hypothetical protein [Arundinibacter roseus]|uniref:Uncharacterized protein n=1 Tax=Arundinibacter roseus TaxID=2070510 RepID=A0A4V2XAC1_9BACT|nr:hypothetical protein [Arundinibacter roseus]TDB67085.1 hypothetical protein EZE20_08200 [Arundinibacter roseus]